MNLSPPPRQPKCQTEAMTLIRCFLRTSTQKFTIWKRSNGSLCARLHAVSPGRLRSISQNLKTILSMGSGTFTFYRTCKKTKIHVTFQSTIRLSTIYRRVLKILLIISSKVRTLVHFRKSSREFRMSLDAVTSEKEQRSHLKDLKI